MTESIQTLLHAANERLDRVQRGEVDIVVERVPREDPNHFSVAIVEVTREERKASALGISANTA